MKTHHVFYIDPLEKLNLKKDSSLALALALQEEGQKVGFLFEKDLVWSNQKSFLKVHRFKGSFKDNGAYLDSVELRTTEEWSPAAGEILHMRLDPPFDGRYLRYLWILDQWERAGVRVINRPRGIMQFNEKLLAYQQPGAVASWVGEEAGAFRLFVSELKAQGIGEMVLKPLDLYSGIGVEKWSLTDPGLIGRFVSKAQELGGPVVAQPFIEAVRQGEVRAIYYNNQLLGAILKTPKEGEFISNIAQGAAFHRVDLPVEVHQRCLNVCQGLSQEGVPWVAFDILGGVLTEVNITCPGLLVEVGHAHGKNLAKELAKQL